VTATKNANVVIGNDSDEIIRGAVGTVSYLSGSGGNDTLIGAINAIAPGSTLEGGAGNDSLFSDGVGDIALGGLGNDTIFNDSGRASLSGGSGNDVITGADDQTTVYGGVGNDSITFADEKNVAFGEDGDDTIIGLKGNDIFSGGAGNDYIEGAEAANSASLLFGNSGNDTLYLGDTSPDSAYGGQGDDSVFAGSTASANGQYLSGDKGADKITYLGKGKDVVLDGDRSASGQSVGTDAGADTFVLASSGTDLPTNLFILGGGGNDSVIGSGTGAVVPALLGVGASIFAGKGDDYFNVVSSGSAQISGDLGNDSGSVALSGNDTLFGDGATQGSDAALGNDQFTVTGSGGNFIFGDTALGTIGGNDTLDVTKAGSGNVIYGGGGNDSLVSAGGNTLIGGAGNDIYVFGAGDKVLFDSLGVNTYVAGSGASTSDVVTVQAGDSFTGGATFLVTGEAELIKTLSNGGVIASDAKDLIQIGTVDGVTSLKGGDDTFSGVNLAGSGVVSGGDGNDNITFTGTDVAAGLIDGGSGNDIVKFTDTLGASIAAKVVGGDGNDTLDVAGIFAGSFSGGAGNDVVKIGTVAAGASIDLGAGDERIVIAQVGTAAGIATILGGEGNDTISVGSDLSSGTSTDLVIDGGAGNDIIYGKQYGGDSISGGAGNDTLFGGGFGVGAGSSVTGTNTSQALGDTLVGGAGADVFVLGTSAKLGYLLGTANGVGTQNFGQDGFFFTGSSATAAGSGVFNGVFGADVIVDFNPAEDKIYFNSGGGLGTVAFVSGSTGYLTDDLTFIGGYAGSDGTSTGRTNSFGLVGQAGSTSDFGVYNLPFGTGYVAATAVGGTGSGRILLDTLPDGGTAFGSLTGATVITVDGGTAAGFFGFDTGGTGGAEIGTSGGFYDTGNGAYYHNGQLLAIFPDKPALTAANFLEINFTTINSGAPLVL
jgi:Ca2+-binding RTX toxin-like protein